MKRVFVLLIALACVACGGPGERLQQAPAPTLEQGWTELRSQDGRVTIGVPQTFHNALDIQKPAQIDTQEQPAAPAPDAGDPSSQPPSQDSSQQAADQAMNRFAGDINAISGRMEEDRLKEIQDEMEKNHYVAWAWLNGNPTFGEKQTAIAVQELDGAGKSLDAAMKDAKVGMLGDVKVDKVSLPIGNAMVAKSDQQNMVGDEITDIRYVLVDGSDEYVVKFTATNGASNIEPIADPVMQTLRIKPKTG